MTPSRLRWGLLLVAIGAMLLLNNTGALSWEYWLHLLYWWPILLIAIGVEKIFLRTKLQILSYISPLILVGTMVYIAIDTGSTRTFTHDFFSRYRWSEASDASVHLTEATIENGSADLHIGRGGSDLVSARFDRFSRKPKIDFSKNNGIAKLEMQRGSWGGKDFIVINNRRGGRAWNLSFSEEVPLKLTCRGRNADIDLNMATIPMENLLIDDPGGEIYLKVGTLKPRVNVELSGRDAQLQFRIPDGIGVKVAGSGISDYLKRKGFIERSGDYFSGGYDTSNVQISLKINNELEEFSIEPY
jgi:LiaF transmembrane domain